MAAAARNAKVDLSPESHELFPPNARAVQSAQAWETRYSGVNKTAPCQPRNKANAVRNTIWLHTNPRQPNTRVSANKMAGLYAMVGVKRLLHIDPSTTPKIAAPTAIAIRIRRSVFRKKGRRSKAMRVIQEFYTVTA
jgi:hypothetical protein